MVDARQPIEFVHYSDTLSFVIGRTDQVSDAVDDNKVDAAVPMMVEVEAVFDELQTVFARECGEENGVVKRWHCIEPDPPQGLPPRCGEAGTQIALCRSVGRPCATRWA